MGRVVRRMPPRPGRIPDPVGADRGRGRDREPVDPVSGRRRGPGDEGELDISVRTDASARVDLRPGACPPTDRVAFGGGFVVDGVQTTDDRGDGPPDVTGPATATGATQHPGHRAPGSRPTRWRSTSG
jgi:hypothetical protein